MVISVRTGTTEIKNFFSVNVESEPNGNNTDFKITRTVNIIFKTPVTYLYVYSYLLFHLPSLYLMPFKTGLSNYL